MPASLARTRISGTVTHHPYRTANVHGVLISGPISEYADLELTLTELAGVRPGNHEVFTIEDNGKTIHVMFTDGKVRIGTEIVLGRW